MGVATQHPKPNPAMPLSNSDLGKPVYFRDDDGRWLPAHRGGTLIGLEWETDRAWPWRKSLRWARVRLFNGAIWRFDIARVRVIETHPDLEQPQCLPGTIDSPDANSEA